MSCPDKPPFFIVGHPRSGTTLLRFMLSAHPRLHVPDETGFVPFLRSSPTAPLTPRQISAEIERIGQLNQYWAGMVADPDAFAAQMQPPTLRGLLDVLYCQRIAATGAVRWGDKTPLYVQFLPQLRAIWPHAKIIHVIRDGRDAALSARQKWPQARYMDLTYLLHNWVRNVQTGRAVGSGLGRDYVELRYERLVQEPEASLRQICAFLDEEFTPDMLHFEEVARREGGGPDGHVEAQRPLSRASVGRWQAQLTPFERKLAKRIAEPLLAELGYTPTQAEPPTSAERLTMLWLDARFRAVDAVRTGLYRSGLLTLNRNRRA